MTELIGIVTTSAPVILPVVVALIVFLFISRELRKIMNGGAEAIDRLEQLSARQDGRITRLETRCSIHHGSPIKDDNDEG